MRTASHFHRLQGETAWLTKSVNSGAWSWHPETLQMFQDGYWVRIKWLSPGITWVPAFRWWICTPIQQYAHIVIYTVFPFLYNSWKYINEGYTAECLLAGRENFCRLCNIQNNSATWTSETWPVWKLTLLFCGTEEREKVAARARMKMTEKRDWWLQVCVSLCSHVFG